MERLLLRPTEAAELLGLGRAKTYQMLREGSLPKVVIGKTVRVPAAELRRWVEEQAASGGRAQ